MIFKDSNLLTTLLTPALKVWLSSQLETVQGLQIKLVSTDQQLLRGIISKVSLTSDFAIYQGLNFDQISLAAEEIKVNITQILKGEPLQLLKPISISVKMRMTETHLNESLPSSLLQSGLKDFLFLLLPNNSLPDLHWESITLDRNSFILKGKSVLIAGEVSLKSPQHLLISPIRIEGLELNTKLVPIELDLGSQVHLEDLIITEDAIFIEGNLIVFT